MAQKPLQRIALQTLFLMKLLWKLPMKPLQKPPMKPLRKLLMRRLNL